MHVYDFLHRTDGCRVFLIGELHQNPSDTAAVIYILKKMVDAGKNLHFFVEYFDSTQNEVIQPYMAAVEYHDKPGPVDPLAGTTPAHIHHLINVKPWPAHYFGGGGAQTFQASWMHQQEIGKIKAILIFANANGIPVKGFDLPLNRGADGGEFPHVMAHPSFAQWDRGRDTWMAHHLNSFLLNDARIAVCFLGAAHCDGIKYGTRKMTIGLTKMTAQRIVSLVPNHAIAPSTAGEFIVDLGRDDYELRPTALTSTMQLTPAKAFMETHRIRGG